MAKYENLTVSSLTISAAATSTLTDTVTLNQPAGIITTKPLTTAADQNYSLVLTNNLIRPQDIVFVSVSKGTDTVGPLVVNRVVPALGSVEIVITNEDSVNPLNGTVRISFAVIRLG